MTPLDPAALRLQFPALTRTGEDGLPVIFADAPGGSQVPETVIDAMAGHLRSGISNTHGAFAASEETDALIAEARGAAADVTGADPGEIVFGPNSTTLLLHLSRSFGRTLRPGDEIVVTKLDHDANIRPWVLAAEDAGATVRWVDIRDDDVTLDLGSFEAALCDRTRLVAFTLASNAVGTVPPAGELIRMIHDAGALASVDGVHFAQHRALDLHALDADILACSPYKFFGPHLGVLSVRRELLDSWTPYKLRPAPDGSPDRWETGTQNHEGMAGLIAAVDYLADVGRTYGEAEPPEGRRAAVLAGFAAIGAHERALSERFLRGVSDLPNVRLWGIADDARVDERTPTFAVRVDDQDPLKTATELARRGIYVWDGHYYAITVMERLGLLDSGGAVRIGFCHYHSLDDVDRVLGALADLA
jgi:cysteine desulfurase family protein (TIGR01976 family)